MQTYWQAFDNVSAKVFGWVHTFSDGTNNTKLIKIYINESNKKNATHWQELLKKSSFSTVIWTDRYLMSSDVLELTSVWYIVGNTTYTIKPVTNEQFISLDTSQSSTQLYYTLFNENEAGTPSKVIALSPIPSDIKTIYFYYKRSIPTLSTNPSVLTDQNTNLVAEVVENIDEEYACWKIYRFLEQHAEADRYQSDYTSSFKQLKAFIWWYVNTRVVSPLKNTDYPLIRNPW